VKPTLRGVLAAVAVLALAALFVRFGFWQLGRLEERRARNAAVVAASALPPLRLDAETFARAEDDPGALAWRAAEAVGRFDHRGDQVLRGRSRDGRPGVLVASPLVLDGGGSLMVIRGWVPSPDAATVELAPLRTTEEVRVRGVLLPVPRQEDRGLPVPARGGDTTWRRLDLEVARARAPGRVLPVYLQQLPDGAVAEAPPHPEPLPELTEGNHLGYAIQWFSFAAIALVGLGILAARGRR
jgi:surfeit locus 1 family protein